MDGVHLTAALVSFEKHVVQKMHELLSEIPVDWSKVQALATKATNTVEMVRKI